MFEKLTFYALRTRRALQLAQDGEWRELVERLKRRFAAAGPGPDAALDPEFYQPWRAAHFAARKGAPMPVVGVTFVTAADGHSPAFDFTKQRIEALGLAPQWRYSMPGKRPGAVANRLAKLLADCETEFVAVVNVGHAPSERFATSFDMARTVMADVYYGDAEHAASDGRLHAPFFRPDYSAERLLEQPYFDGFVVYRTAHLRTLARPTAKVGGAASYDLLLRACDSGKVHHAADLWSVEKTEAAKEFPLPESGSKDDQRLAVQAALRRRKRTAVVELGQLPGTLLVRPKLQARAQASLIIPFRDKPELLDQCLSSLKRITTGARFEVILVDNGSEQPATHRSVREWQSKLDARLLTIPGPFNYADLNNRAARVARGDVLVLLNNDTEIIDADWLTTLVGWAEQPDIGAVGPLLLYGDRSIQHAGVLLGVQRIAIHAYQWMDENTDGYFGGAKVVSNPSAVTGACLAVAKKKYWEVGGLDDVAFKIAFNDLDLCMKLEARGYRTLFTPHARLIHHESKSRGTMLDVDEDREFHRRYRDRIVRDPGYNPHLSKLKPDFRLA